MNIEEGGEKRMEFKFGESFEKNYEIESQKFEENLTTFLKENPDASGQEVILEALPLSVNLSMRTTRAVLDEYHAALMEYLNK